MSTKLRIAVFASTLREKNPRGATRLFRRLSEALVELEASLNLELWVVTRRVPGCRDPLLECSRLREWLERNPLEYTASSAAWISPVVQWRVKELAKALLSTDQLNILKTVFQVLRRAFFRFGHRADRTETLGEDRPATYHADDFDFLLNFWWFHSGLNELASVARLKRARVVSWFLDAIPLHIRPTHHRLIGIDRFYREVGSVVRSSQSVVAISRSAADDLTHYFGIERKRVAVVGGGVEERVYRPIHSAILQRLHDELGIVPDLPIILCVGIEEPSKNVLNHLRALIQLRSHAFQVVLVGEAKNEGVERSYGGLLRELQKRVPVSIVGYLSDDDLSALYQMTHTLVYASLWEGFGLPPLEALACGATVVVSDIGPSPEVCGDAAIYVDPYEPTLIAQAIGFLLSEATGAREIRIGKGREHARAWTWALSAQKLVRHLREELVQEGTLL